MISPQGHWHNCVRAMTVTCEERSRAHYSKPDAVVALEHAYRSPEVASQRAKTLEVLSLVPGEAVLDVGCGVGQLSSELAVVVGPSGRVCGVDTSPAMIARASARLRGNEEAEAAPLEYSVGSAVALPFPDDSFDAIVCVQVCASASLYHDVPLKKKSSSLRIAPHHTHHTAPHRTRTAPRHTTLNRAAPHHTAHATSACHPKMHSILSMAIRR